MLCSHHPYLIPEHFHHRKREALYPSAVPIPSSPFPLSTTNLLYGSIKFPVMDISHKGNHTICSLLCVCSRIHLRNFSDFFNITAVISKPASLWISYQNELSITFLSFIYVVACIKHVFYFLFSDALTSGALLTLEGWPLPRLANS